MLNGYCQRNVALRMLKDSGPRLPITTATPDSWSMMGATFAIWKKPTFRPNDVVGAQRTTGTTPFVLVVFTTAKKELVMR